jgi:hypothetical protein
LRKFGRRTPSSRTPGPGREAGTGGCGTGRGATTLRSLTYDAISPIRSTQAGLPHSRPRRLEGKLTDQATREFIAAHLSAFKAWVLQLK